MENRFIKPRAKDETQANVRVWALPAHGEKAANVRSLRGSQARDQKNSAYFVVSALIAFDFCSVFQEGHYVDQLLNCQKVVVYTHGRPSVLHRVTRGCHDRVGFNNGLG